MPPYSEMDPAQRGTFKFLRVDDRLVIGSSKMAHRDIANEEGIAIELLKASFSDKTRADAGFVDITEESIFIYDQSILLGAKLLPEARLRTLEAFRKQTTRTEDIAVRKADIGA